MPVLPSPITLPLRAAAEVASLSASLLERTAGLLRHVAGDGDGHVAAEPDPADVAAPATGPSGAARPRRSRAVPEARAEGRSAAERREPTLEPATGATAATPRRASSPKAARKVRKRPERATATDTVAAPGARGRGGTPATGRAENIPTERARARAGREPAPMGSEEDSGATEPEA
jgi:hypothetical protein